MMAAMTLIVWEFRVKPGCEPAFEALHGPDGDWASLLARDPHWRSTRLLRDPVDPGRYVTLDEWREAGDFDAFRQRHAAAYDSLDQAGARLTEWERRLGAFEPAGVAAREGG